MTVREYLELSKHKGQITFIKARARKDAHTPYYHCEYQTTPIFSVYELEDSRLMDYIVLNHKQPPIDWLSGARWQGHFNKGFLASLLIISKEDLELRFSPAQAQQTADFIGERITEEFQKED